MGLKNVLFGASCALLASLTFGSLDVQVDPTTAAYTIQVNGATWFESSYYALRYNGTDFNNGPSGGLQLDSVVPYNGSDTLGTFTGYQASWQNGIYLTRFKQYAAVSAVVFEAEFTQTLVGTAHTHSNAYDDLVNAFPTFGSLDSINSDLGYIAWSHCMCAGNVRTWTTKGINSDDFGREGGVVAWFDASGTTAVLSTNNNFMVGGLAFATTANNTFGAGLLGMVEPVPAGFVHQVIMVAGSGINDTMHAWGDLLLQQSGKQRTKADADLVVSTLSYWTDNGAYYYYNTEPNATYQQTITDSLTYMKSLQLPIQYVQFDSWWYYKMPNKGALLLWEPMPSVFPDGLTPWVGMPTTLHNRYFADINNYTANFTFLRDPGAECSLPIDKNLFVYIMQDKIKNWGMVQYEQDWLITTYEAMNVTQTNVTAAHDWLTAMADAATELGVTIQYCMPLPNHILHSTLSQPVTNARASGDYHPGATNFEIGKSSLFYWAVGIAPSKDDWWTTEVQPGNPYSDNPSEPNWQLQAIVIGLSTGPNGPSDGIGFTNASLVMSTVRGDGITLQPDRPLITSDAAMKAVFQLGYDPDVRTTWTQLGQYRWHFVLAVSLNEAFTLAFNDFGPALSANAYGVYDYFNMAPGPVTIVNSKTALTIPTGTGQPSAPSTAHSIRYYIAAPVLSSGWTFIGEVGKVTAVSAQRLSNLQVTATGFSVNVQLANEPAGIKVLVQPPAGAPVAIACSSGSKTLQCLTSSANSCVCS